MFISRSLQKKEYQLITLRSIFGEYRLMVGNKIQYFSEIKKIYCIPLKVFVIFYSLAGWGGRDRTFVSRDQNPLPYHLATPH